MDGVAHDRIYRRGWREQAPLDNARYRYIIEIEGNFEKHTKQLTKDDGTIFQQSREDNQYAMNGE